MSLPAHLRHFLRTKGFLHALERSGEVLLRFRAGREKFRCRLEEFEQVFGPAEVRVTFCVTASLLERHRDLIEELKSQGHEIAAHGLVHTRMDRYSLAEQTRQIQASWGAMEAAGFEVSGFRCPYLNFNQDTMAGLQASPYSWTSGEVIWWHDGQPVREGANRLDGLYHFVSDTERAGLPHLDGGLVHIPITSPDDELLYERQRVRDPHEMAEIWWKTFCHHHQRGGLYHQFFHPERFTLIRPALEKLLSRINELGPQVWKPTLGELAEWWRDGRQKAEGEGTAELVRQAAAVDGAGIEAQGSVSKVQEGQDEPRTVLGTAEPSTPGTHESGTMNQEPETIQWPEGARSCCVLSADICAIDLRDFVSRTRYF